MWYCCTLTYLIIVTCSPKLLLFSKSYGELFPLNPFISFSISQTTNQILTAC